MKLLKLPYLVIQDVLTKMSYSSLFFLSFCSRRMKKIVKIQKLRLMKPRIYINENFWILYIGRIEVVFLLKLDMWTKTTQFLTMDGMTFPCNWRFHNEGIRITHSPDFMPFFEIVQFFCDVFNFPTSSTLYDVSIRGRHLHIPRGTIERSKMEIWRKKMSIENCLEKIDKFYTDHPNQEMSILDGDFTIGEERERELPPQIFEIPNLMLLGFKWKPNPYLSVKHFKGKHFLLVGHLREQLQMKQFFMEWKNGKYPNVETVILQNNEKLPAWPPAEQILEGLNTRRWDPEIRERCYPYRSIMNDYTEFQDFQNNQKFFDCTRGHDIIRTSDKKLATIKLQSQFLMFFVWQ